MVFTSRPPMALGLRTPDLGFSSGGGGPAGVEPPLSYPQPMRIWVARMLVCRSIPYRLMSEQFTPSTLRVSALRGRLFAPADRAALNAPLSPAPSGADWP